MSAAALALYLIAIFILYGFRSDDSKSDKKSK